MGFLQPWQPCWQPPTLKSGESPEPHLTQHGFYLHLYKVLMTSLMFISQDCVVGVKPDIRHSTPQWRIGITANRVQLIVLQGNTTLSLTHSFVARKLVPCKIYQICSVTRYWWLRWSSGLKWGQSMRFTLSDITDWAIWSIFLLEGLARKWQVSGAIRTSVIAELSRNVCVVIFRICAL